MDDTSPPSSPRAGRYAFAALIVANIFLAFGPWMVRLSDVGPVAAGFWRLALAIPFLLLLMRVGRKGSFAVGWGMAGVIALGGVFFAADLAAWHYGIVRTKLANATLFGNTASLIFPVYGFIIARALPGKVQIGALVLAIVGAGLLLGSSYELSAEHFEGDLFAILAGLFYCLYLIVIDRARRTLAPMPVLALATIAGALPILLFALALGEQVMPRDWTPLILLSLGSQVIGQGLLVYAVGHLSPLVVGLGLLTQPVITAVNGWLAYDERLSTTDFVGAVLICAALVLIRLPEREPADLR
jgi:drug/metabolite transporter (DMT)-like permease